MALSRVMTLLRKYFRETYHNFLLQVLTLYGAFCIFQYHGMPWQHYIQQALPAVAGTSMSTTQAERTG